jgi:hypothetical protein
MLRFFKKRLFRKMIGYVDNIKLAVYAKLWPEFEKSHNQEKAKQLAAAVVNRMFAGVVSPIHLNIPTMLIDELATDFLKGEMDKDLITETINRISDTVHWIKDIIPLPPDRPDPATMEHLAVVLQSRYCVQ